MQNQGTEKGHPSPVKPDYPQNPPDAGRQAASGGILRKKQAEALLHKFIDGLAQVVDRLLVAFLRGFYNAVL